MVIELWSALACSLYNLQKSFFQLSNVTIFVKFEESLSKYESNEICWSKSHISTSEHYYGSE